jgi:drug/metabolite transporter (DMT)-like permease
MNLLLIPLLAAITQAASLILHKIGISKRSIPLSQYIPLLFLFLTIYTLLAFPLLGWINLTALAAPRNIAFIILILTSATFWNYLYFTAIKSEHVNLIENIISLSPITTIAVTWIFAPTSFDIRIAAAALLATAAMIWGYWHKHKFQFSHAAWLLLLSVLFMSIENVLVGLFLQQRTMSPVILFALRAAVMCAFFWIYYKPLTRPLKKSSITYIALIAILSTIMMLLKFYALRDSGILFTSLILILVPFIVFLASIFVLHEKIRPKQIITIIIVLLAVLYATLLQN